MYYTLTKQEYDYLTNEANSVESLKATIRQLDSMLGFSQTERIELKNENTELIRQVRQAENQVVNIGTYPKDLALQIAKTVKDCHKRLANNPSSYTAPIKGLKLRGRGKRTFADTKRVFRESLPQDRAEKFAIYVTI